MRLLRAAVAAGLLLALLVASPARAAVATIEVSTSGPARDNPTGSPQVAGTVTAASGCVVDGITLTLTSPESHPLPGPQSAEGNGQSTQSFSWVPSLPDNGHYVVEVEAVQRQSSVLAECAGTATAQADLWVEAKPAPVEVTRSQTDSKNRTVTIVWKRGAEADLLGYLVYRAHGSGDPEPVYGTDQPASGSTVTFLDDLSGEEGGSYRYTLTALRPSADWFQPDRRRPPAASDDSGDSTASATLPAQPKPVTTTQKPGGGTGGSGSGGATGSGGIRSVGRINFGAFASELNAARRSSDETEPDPGFDERLGYKDKTTLVEEPGRALRPLPETEGDGRPTTLLSIATALLLLAVAGHLLWLRQEVARHPLEALTPAGVEPVVVPVAADPAAVPTVRRRRKPAAG